MEYDEEASIRIYKTTQLLADLIKENDNELKKISNESIDLIIGIMFLCFTTFIQFAPPGLSYEELEEEFFSLTHTVIANNQEYFKRLYELFKEKKEKK